MQTLTSRIDAHYRASTGDLQAFGATPQEALNTLMQTLLLPATQPIVIWPYNHGDAFFTQTQQTRLQELKAQRETLSSEEQQELQDLIAASFDATIARTQTPPLVKS